jgi:hypothetical protein
MGIEDLAVIGAKIVEVGAKLKELREQRDTINVDISALEKELTPLVVQHSKIIAEIVGTAAPVVAAPTAATGPAGSAQPPQGPGPDALASAKKRIVEYLKDAEPGVSATDVAQALRLDPFLVRQAMADLSRNGR